MSKKAKEEGQRAERTLKQKKNESWSGEGAPWAVCGPRHEYCLNSCKYINDMYG